MKRLWVGIILLLILLAGTMARHRGHGPHLCAHGGSPGSGGSGESGGALWALAGSDGGLCGPMDPWREMDSLFARAEVCGDEQERKALCAELAQRARAMSNAHSPTWWNLL